MINKNEKKAQEIAKRYKTPCHGLGDCEFEAYQSALEAMEWKDEQIAEENKWINVKDKLPRLVTTEFGIRGSKPVLCKTKSGKYCVARCFQYKTNPHFWQDDYYEKPNVKFWKEING